MFSTLALAALIAAAPVPKDAKPAGPAPRVLELAAEADGKVRVAVTRTETRKVPTRMSRVVNGVVVTETVERELTSSRSVQVELNEVKDLTLYTADGKEADKAQAFKKLADGGVVIVSSDGQKVDQKYLKLFRDDVLVLVAAELGGAAKTTMPRPSPFGAVLVGGAIAPGLQPAQILPVPVAPPIPLPVPAPAPVPEKKG